jgi:hypothetical protein
MSVRIYVFSTLAIFIFSSLKVTPMWKERRSNLCLEQQTHRASPG